VLAEILERLERLEKRPEGSAGTAVKARPDPKFAATVAELARQISSTEELSGKTDELASINRKLDEWLAAPHADELASINRKLDEWLAAPHKERPEPER
jgi:hypothetical protein